MRCRLIILAVLVVCCNAGSIGYGYQSPEKKHQSFFPPVNRNEFVKSFYFFAAPDDDDISYNYTPPEIKKNVQVVVIKAPEYNGYTKAALDLAKQAVQTKNLIYVLSKQPDIGELYRRFEEISSGGIPKPEVRFVKYKTPEEARSAQQAIKIFYDNENLQGDSNSLDVSVAPALDRSKSSSSVPKDDDDDDYDDLFTARKPPFLPKGIDVVPGSSYLPPKRD